MSTAIIVLFFMAIFHWFYQAAIAPTNKLLMEGRLAALEASLAMQANEIGKDDPKVVPALKELLSSHRAVLGDINIANFVYFSLVYKREKKRKSADGQSIGDFDFKLIENNPKAFDVAKDSSHVAVSACFMNSVPLLILLTPVLVFATFIFLLKGKKAEDIARPNRFNYIAHRFC